MIEAMVRKEVDMADPKARNRVGRSCEKKNEVNVIAIADERKFKLVIMIEQTKSEGMWFFAIATIFVPKFASAIVEGIGIASSKSYVDEVNCVK